MATSSPNSPNPSLTPSRDEMRARAFTKCWTVPQREKSETKTFLDEFSTIFGGDLAAAAQAVLDARAPHLDAGATLADLYNPLAMPASLLKAHQALDHAVDKSYRSAPFPTDRDRVEYLFTRYEQLTAPLMPATKRKKQSRTQMKPIIQTST